MLVGCFSKGGTPNHVFPIKQLQTLGDFWVYRSTILGNPLLRLSTGPGTAPPLKLQTSAAQHLLVAPLNYVSHCLSVGNNSPLKLGNR